MKTKDIIDDHYCTRNLFHWPFQVTYIHVYRSHYSGNFTFSHSITGIKCDVITNKNIQIPLARHTVQITVH